MLYRLLKPVAGVALRWYYRSIAVAGLERVPATGPVFLAVNHPNALVDALVVAWAMPRRVRFTAKATIFANPLVAAFLHRAGVVPLRRAHDEQAGGAPEADRNAAAFAAVAAALADGAAVLIFPEGRSHDEPKLAPLRTGLARMALTARDTRGVHDLVIVPIGLLFERKEAPRSRVLLQVGEPLRLAALPAEGAQVAILTDAVARRLAAVTLNFDRPEDADRILGAGRTLAALVSPVPSLGDGDPPLGDILPIVRRIDRAHRAATARNDGVVQQRIERFEQRLAAFRETLQEAHIDASDVAIDPGLRAGSWFVLREALIATLVLPLSLWGRLTHGLPIRLTRALALRSVTARDEPAMRTLVLGLLVVLAAYAAETVLVGVVAGWWWALAFAATLVPSASSDFRYGDRARRLRTRARAWRRFRRDPAWHRRLLEDADWLRTEAGALERLAVAG